jgi:NitT/TauT family transport system substrate-binding protein
MHHLNKRSARATAAALALLALAGCGDSGETTEAGEMPSLRLDVVRTGTQAIIPYVIDKHGLDRKHGFVIEQVPNSGVWGANWVSLKGGRADCTVASWLEIEQNRAGGTDTVAVQPLMKMGNALVVGPESGIDSIEDLRDKKIGVYNPSAPDWLLIADSVRRRHGLDLGEANEVSAAAPGLLEGLIERGAIDAAFTYTDIALRMQTAGKGRILFTANSLFAEDPRLDGAPFIYYIFKEDFLRENPELAERFRLAYADALGILRTDDAIWTELAGLFEMESEAGIAALRRTIRPILDEDWHPEHAQVLTYMLGRLRALGGESTYSFDTITPTAYAVDLDTRTANLE